MKIFRNIFLTLALMIGAQACIAPSALATQVLLNNTSSRLAAAVGVSDTTITVTSGEGVKFALATGGNTIRATLVKISGFREIAWEIVDVTARSSDTLTITRARESTTALTFAIGDVIDVRFTAGIPLAHIDSVNTFVGTQTVTGSIAPSGNLAFSGTANRITGDMSNATIASRVAFQNSVTNGNTLLEVMPNGTGNISAITLEGSSGQANGSMGQLILTDAAAFTISSAIRGAGTHVPITFNTSALEKVRIDIAGNIGLTGAASAWGTSALGTAAIQTGGASFAGIANAPAMTQNLYFDATNWKYYASSVAGAAYTQASGQHNWWIAPSGTAGNTATLTRAMMLNTSGQVGIGTNAPDSSLTINANTGSFSAPIDAGTALHIVGADGVVPAIEMNSYGTSIQSDWIFKSARGTAASKSALQTDDQIGIIKAAGYGATGYATTARAKIQFMAAENWTDTAQGSYMSFYTNRVGAAANTEALRIDAAGHLKPSGTAPALTSCGTSPTIVGTDVAGTITMGTGSPTGCVITFNVAYLTTAPHCTVTWQTNIASMQYTISTSAITLTQTATSSNKVNYMCMSAT